MTVEKQIEKLEAKLLKAEGNKRVKDWEYEALALELEELKRGNRKSK